MKCGVYLYQLQAGSFKHVRKTSLLTKDGQVLWTPAGKHLPANIGDKPFSLILVEMKNTPAVMKKD